MTHSDRHDPAASDITSTNLRQQRQLAISMVMTGVLHEINNPLNSIMMNAELAQMLLSTKRSPERMEALMTSISDQCRQAGELTSRISEFIRKPNLNMSEDVCLQAAMVTARRLIWSVAEAHEVSVELDSEDTLPTVAGNSIALSICVAMIMIQLINARFKTLRIGIRADGDHSLGVTLSHDADKRVMPEPNQSMESLCRKLEVWSMIEQIIDQHQGVLRFESHQLSLMLRV